MTGAKRASILPTVIPTAVFAFMAGRAVTADSTQPTGLMTGQIRVVKEPHRVYTPHAVEGQLKLSQAGSIRPVEVFSGVFESVTQCSEETKALAFQEVSGWVVDLLTRDPDHLGAIP